MWAPESTAAVTLARVAASRSPVSRPVRRPRNDLRDVPTSMGRSSRAKPVESCDEVDVLIERLPKADARIEHDTSRVDAEIRGNLEGSTQVGLDLDEDVRARREPLHALRGAPHVHEYERRTGVRPRHVRRLDRSAAR